MKILIPTDFSPQADFALILAKRLASKIPVSVEMLHVIPCRTEARLGADGTVEVEEDSVQGYLQARYQAALKGFEMYDFVGFEGSETMVEFGPLSETIVRRASEAQFDLILMGTKGAFGLKEIVGGSETQHVVRASNTPVLSLMCDRSDLEIKNILLVHSILDEKAALPMAVKQIAQAFDATIHIIQDEGSNSPATSEAAFSQFVEREGLDITKAKFYLDQISERAIVGFDQIQHMDLIVIGTEFRKGIQQIFRKNLAEKIVNHMYKPVITYHL